MDHDIAQPSSNIPTHSDDLQLAVLTQRNKRPNTLNFTLLKLNTTNTKMN